MITDWLLVVITAIYVVATIYIMRANQKTAEISKQQIDESKKQFDESRRLQVLPYLQIHISDVIVDEKHNNKPIVNVSLKQTKTEGDSTNNHSVCYISTGESISSFIHTIKTNTKPYLFNVALVNNGEGIAHHIKLEMEYKEQHFCTPGEYMIPAHGGILESNVALFTSFLNKKEVQKIKKLRPGCIPVDVGIINLSIQYQDVLGNNYKQSVRSALMRYEERISLTSDDYFISAPELIK